MNSSLKQLRLSGKPLKDAHMQGPSAFVDLFTVILGIQEFQYALTKDLSNFYQ
jgi:hypothetical protein